MQIILNKFKGAVAPLVCTVLFSAVGMAQEVSYTHDKQYQSTEENQMQENNATEWYGGIGLSSVKAVCVDRCEDITFGVIGKVGYDVNEYLGIEGRVIKTFWEYEQQKVEHYGVFAKPMLPITEDLHLYGLLGYAKTKTGDLKKYDESGLAWGIGANYYFTNDTDELEELQKELKQLSQAEQQKLGTAEEQQARTQRIHELKESIEGFDLGKRFGVFIDYERLLQKSNAPDFDAINLGVSYDF